MTNKLITLAIFKLSLCLSGGVIRRAKENVYRRDAIITPFPLPFLFPMHEQNYILLINSFAFPSYFFYIMDMNIVDWQTHFFEIRISSDGIMPTALFSFHIDSQVYQISDSQAVKHVASLCTFDIFPHRCDDKFIPRFLLQNKDFAISRYFFMQKT